MRIDSHHSSTARYTVAYLETILKRNRFERSIFVGPPQELPEHVAGIVAPIAEARPDPKLRGVQISSPAELPGAARFGLPIDLLELLPEVPAIAAEVSGVPLVIDHLGYPCGETWARDLEAAARFPNVYCKLSGLRLVDEPHARARYALGLFGPGRLMFGSDWPRGLPDHTWKAALALFTQSIGAQTIEVREQLLGGTAAHVYGV